MALLLSEKLQRDRRNKLKRRFEKEFTRELSAIGNKKLTATISGMFKGHLYPPNPDQFLRMITASKFGGENAFLEGGIWVNHAFDQVNFLINSDSEKRILDGWYSSFSYNSAQLGNCVNFINIEGSVLPFMKKLEKTNFRQVVDHPNVFLDRETSAFGLLIFPHNCMDLKKFKDFMDTCEHTDENWERPLAPWEQGKFPELQLHEGYSTGHLEYISDFEIFCATTEEIIKLVPDRQRHNVSEHEREIQPGTFTTVNSHERKNPLKSPIKKSALTDHVVYLVKDHLKTVKYIGEGLKDRPKHVNSGASHNKKINEHFFKLGPMTIEIVAEGLTKSEALTIEKLLLDQSRDLNLWNSRDYEPFEDYSYKHLYEKLLKNGQNQK